MIPDTYVVEWIKSSTAKDYIRKNHYSKSCHNGPSPCYGLFDGRDLIGVLAFSTPCSENVRRSLFGKSEVGRVVELHRLHVKDGTPKNTESWFIGKCLRNVWRDRQITRGVVSFSDTTEGHIGTIYQATNAKYCGVTGRPVRFWRDGDGRLRHPRQNGVNVDGLAMGWTPELRGIKHRYVWVVGPKNEVRAYELMLRLPTLPYPKRTPSPL